MNKLENRLEIDKTRILIPKLNMKSVKINFDNNFYKVFNHLSTKTTSNLTIKTNRSNLSRTKMNSNELSNDESIDRSKSVLF